MMEWQPERNRRVGRPKTTWRRMMKKDPGTKDGAAGQKSGTQHKTAWLVGKRKLQPYSPHVTERTNVVWDE